MNTLALNSINMPHLYRLLLTAIGIILLTSSYSTANYTITVQVDMNAAGTYETVGIRGNISPLSWNKDYQLSDPDGDGIYEGTFAVSDNKKRLQFKFTKDGQIELRNGDNRKAWINDEETIITRVYEQYDYLDHPALDALTYRSEQIDEDIEVLSKTLKAIHPNLYKYQSEAAFDEGIEELRTELRQHPSRSAAYKAISQFAATIECSHTFTNPWNQHSTTDKAIFYQPYALPFTFDRLGKRLFIKYDISHNDAIRSGQELITINGKRTEVVITTLAEYIAADGDNYEKRLQRLTVDGKSKFELWDIFYTLVYGNYDQHAIQLYDHNSRDTVSTIVDALSPSVRTARLYDTYEDFDADFSANFQYKLIDANTAYLKLGTFAVFNDNYDWKGFIDKAFENIRKEKVDNLIIDIRGNEGGDAVVAEYVLKNIITTPIETTTATSTTSYRKVPEEIKKHISTWDKQPYDWGSKVDEISADRFQLKSKYDEGNRSYKPSKKGFRGNSYLLTDATNSSATHLMATYTKIYNLATIVGEPTGGNQKGLNGGYIFFLKLPNTFIEVDIPVFGINVFPDTDNTYNGGIQPDVIVTPTVKDIIAGGDTVLEHVIALIRQ